MMTMRYILLIFVAAALMAGCKSTGKTVRQKGGPAQNTSRLSEEERMRLEYFFFNANKEKILGNTDKAIDLFAQCIRIDNRNAASMYELAVQYGGKKMYNDALFFAQSAAEIDPGNNWYQLLLADLYRQTGKYSESLKVYEKLARNNPQRVDYYFNWANALLYAGKLQEAIDVFDQIEESTGIDRELVIQKERLYLKLGKIDKAAAEVEKLIAADQTDMQAWSLLVELYQANGMKEKVIGTIERMKQVDPESPYVFLALAEYYRSEGDNEKSFEQLKQAFASQRLDSEIKMRIIGSYVPLINQDEKMLAQAVELGEILAQTHPGEAMAHTAYGEFLTLAERFEEANQQYKRALEIDPSNENVWQQYIANTERLRDFDAMLESTAEALELFPNNPLYYLYSGLAHGGKGQYQESVKILLAGSKIVVENDGMLAEFYSLMGDHYHELNNHPESDSHYEKALNLDPARAYTLNNYSYYLSLRKEQLDKAAKMSKRSNEIIPGQASFEDTYGWILFQQGNFTEARDWLEKAMKNGGDRNGTILEHYGDVLFRLGEAQKALEYWQKAKEAGDYSELLDQKIAGKKLVE